MRKEVKDALLKLTDGDEALVSELEERTDSVNRTAETENLIRREDETAAAGPDPEGETGAETIEVDETVITAVSEQVRPGLAEQIATAIAPLLEQIESLKTSLSTLAGQAGKTEELAGAVEGLRERLAALEKSDEQKRAEWQADLPARARVTATYRPRNTTPVETGTPVPSSSVAAETLSKIRK